MLSLKKLSLAIVMVSTLAAHACAPQRPYRAPVPRSTTPLPRAPQTRPPPAPPPEPEIARRPLPEEPKIREQDIKPKSSVMPPAGKDAKDSSKQSTGEDRSIPDSSVAQPTAPPLPDDSSLLAKITPGTTPQRAASLRLTEEGRKLLDAGEPAKALARLERTIVIDSTNPFGYFYLAKTQNRLGRYKESLNFLDVAESRLSGELFWMAEINALRGENFRGLGQLQRAEASYQQALRLNSGNRTAAEGLARLQSDPQAASK